MQLSLQRSLSYSLCANGAVLTTEAQDTADFAHSSKVPVESAMEPTGRNEHAMSHYERCVLGLKALRNRWLYEWQPLDLEQVKQLFVGLALQGFVRPP